MTRPYVNSRLVGSSIVLGCVFALLHLSAEAQMVPVASADAQTASLSTPAEASLLKGSPPALADPAGVAPALPANDESSSDRTVEATLRRADNPGAGSTPGAGGLTRPIAPTRAREVYRMRPLRAVAFGLTASTLGGGAEVAMPLSRTLNLRVGGSYIRYEVPFSRDGVDYDPGVKFTAARSTIDWFPHRGAFHVSVGALYFRNSIVGRATVAEGQTFKLGDMTFVNSVDDPIHGSASIVYHRKTAPMATLGFGNILPRSGRHVSVPFEVGGAYLQPPDMVLDLQGTACTSEGCFDARTTGELRDSLTEEQVRLQKDLRLLQVYPIVSIGLACRF